MEFNKKRQSNNNRPGAGYVFNRGSEMSRIHQIFFVVAIFVISITCTLATDLNRTTRPEVSSTQDLSKLAQLSKTKKLPLLIVFSATHCSYCELLENEFLRPMLISGEYRNKIIIRKIVIDEIATIRNFRGKLIDSDKLIGDFNVSVTPTMLFLDSHGTELAKRMIGINTIDFFGAYLDDAIDQSLKLMKQRKQKRYGRSATSPTL